MDKKRCSKCEQDKPVSEFYRSRGKPTPRCKECLREYNVAYNARAEVKAKIIESELQKRYGITPDDYERMLTQQNGVCAICGDPPTNRRLGVDHNHSTGAVRGLLCYACNHMLGFVESRLSRVQGVAAYLAKYEGVVWEQNKKLGV